MSQQKIESQDDVSAIDLTAFQKETLLAIARLENGDEDSYGLGIKSSLEERLDQEVNHGRLYPNLDELVELDLIEKSELDKRTNQYTLTENGKKVLQEYNDYVEDVVSGL
jgi:DNA-binding PadR family transcriptional regulator